MLLDCEPVFDYGRCAPNWEYTGAGYNEAKATAPDSDVELCLTTDMNVGLRGTARDRPHADEGGRHALRRALVVRAPGADRPTRTAYARLVWTAHHWQHWLDHGEFPDHPWRTYLQRSALTLKGLSYAPTGALVAAATTSLPETPGRRAQLGLPLHLDPRRHVHALGPLHARLRLGGQRLLLLHRRRRRGRGGPAPDHVRDRRRGRAARGRRSTTCRATRERSRCGWATAPTTRTSTTSGARSSTRSTCTRSRATTCPSGSGRSSSSRSRRRSRTGASRTAASGRCAAIPKHFTSSKLMCWVAADRGARLAEIREDLEYAARWQSAADEIQARHLRERARRPRRVHPALRDRRARRVGPADAARALPAARGPAHPQHGARDRRRADG